MALLSNDWDQLAILDTTGQVKFVQETTGELKVKRQRCPFHQ